jgi:hypothetical protein
MKIKPNVATLKAQRGKAAKAPAPKPKEAAPKAAQQQSGAAGASTAGGPAETLKAFGGDRKAAIGSLVASGAKAENPKLGFFKKLGAKIFGGSTTKSKRISANQTINTKVKNRNFQLKRLRLTTESRKPGTDRVLRHVDFHTQAPTGGRAEVKDIGAVIGRGQPRRLIEQEINNPKDGQPGQVKNSFFDPKTGQPFMQTMEVSSKLGQDKTGLVHSKGREGTYREINLLGANGKANRRYVFDYDKKSYRLEHLNPKGEVTGTYKLPRRTNYQKLVGQLSETPPSSRPAPKPEAEKNPKKNIFRS